MTIIEQLKQAWADVKDLPGRLELATAKWVRDLHYPLDARPYKEVVVCRWCKRGTPWPCEHWITADAQVRDIIEKREGDG